jgi:hypothetical protein
MKENRKTLLEDGGRPHFENVPRSLSDGTAVCEKSGFDNFDLLKDKLQPSEKIYVIRRFTRYQMGEGLEKNRKILRKKLQSRFPILKKEGTILCLFSNDQYGGRTK